MFLQTNTKKKEAHLYARIDKTLGSRELGFVFYFNQNQEVQIVPHVMLQFGVLIKRHGPIVELGAIQAAYEACISQRIVFFLFFGSQIAKSVDDNTKNQV